MTEKKSPSSAELTKPVKSTAGVGAAQNVVSTPPSAAVPKPSKKQRKHLSQAAQKRLAEEKLEASKTKAEKLAESIKNRETVGAKHKSVQRHLDDIEERKPKPPQLKPVKPTKVTQLPTMSLAEDNSHIARLLRELKDNEQRRVLQSAELIKNRLKKTDKREKTKLAEALRDCYGIYLRTLLSGWAGKFVG